MKTEVEFCSMLDDGLIEGRKEHVVFIVDFLYGHDKKSVIFADVAAHEGGRAVGTRFVGEQNSFMRESCRLVICVLSNFRNDIGCILWYSVGVDKGVALTDQAQKAVVFLRGCPSILTPKLRKSYV